MRLALWSGLLALLMACAAYGQEVSGWSTDVLVAEMSSLVDGHITVQSGSELPSNILIDPTEEQTCFLRAGESVRFVKYGDAGTAALVGDDKVTHTIQFYYPVLNVSGSEDAGKFYSGIFGYLLPGWPGAEDWPAKSVTDSWTVTGQAMIDPTISIDQTIARHGEGNVRLATNGVPPDVAWLRVTARSECEKVSPYLLASPREALKREEYYRPASVAQLLLTYIHPAPVDVSATPVVLGSSRSRRDGITGTTIAFESPRVAIDTAEWIDLQAKGQRFASTSAAIEEFWGYQQMHLHLIRQPIIPTSIEGSPGIAVIEMLNAQVSRFATGGLSIKPFDVDAVFFSAKPLNRPAVASRDVSFGDLDFVRFVGWAHSVSVSATPIYLGRIHLYDPGVSGDRPGYYAVAPDGLGLSIHSRENAAESRIDLSLWAKRNGMDTASTGSHALTDPVVEFEFDGKSHALVIESITCQSAFKRDPFLGLIGVE